MTHALLWCHATNTMRVQTLDWLLSRGREAYAGNRPMGLVPIAMGIKPDMDAARENCAATLAGRHVEIERQPMMVELIEPRVPNWRCGTVAA